MAYMNAYMLRIEAMNSFIIQGYITLQKCRPELTDFFNFKQTLENALIVSRRQTFVGYFYHENIFVIKNSRKPRIK